MSSGYYIIIQYIVVEMRGGRDSHTQRKNSTDQTKSRKQLRKEKKIEKKEKKRMYFEHKNKPHRNINSAPKQIASTQIAKNKKSQQSKPAIKSKETKISTIQKKVIKKPVPIETEDDKMIRLYEQKLGIAQGKDKYGKIAKKFGFDDDIFDFLDGISKKVYDTQPIKQEQYNEDEEINSEQMDFDQQQMGQQQGEEQEQQQEHQSQQDGIKEENEGYQEEQEGEQIQQQFDDDFDQMFDNLDQIDREDFAQLEEEDIRQYEQPISKKKNKEKKQTKQQQKRPKKFYSDLSLLQKQEKVKPKATNKDTQESPQKQQAKKSLNSLFNKLSDGNVLLTFREMVKIVESHPKSLVIPIFAELFTKFNLMIEKPLFHILATNVALLAALHYAVGNRFIAPVLQALTQKYIRVDLQPQNEAEVMEIGYSKRFQRLKNYATIVSLLYNYGSISGEFIESYVGWLVAKLNKSNIELIYIVIQKCGTYIRSKDPSTLKTVITLVKGAIETLKQQPVGSEQQQKVHFIELQLNQIRFNKKSQNAIDQRMAFLQTFINKNVKKEIDRQKEVFPLNFETLKNLKAEHLSRTNWWDNDHNANDDQKERDGQGNQGEQINEVVKQKNKLFELAKSFHMVTQTKRNIFVCLMDSKDYLQATQRILQLKIKNMQEVATVLVQICTLQPNFNPYYPLVGAKLASLIPKFRLHIQYALWDHLKLIGQYELRRTSNLAKFTAKIIAEPIANCSLSLLKFYPDLSNLEAIDRTFLDIFLGYFFKKVSKEYLSKLVSKLREDNNRDVKLGIQQYLSEFEAQADIRDKLQICRRLLAIELDDRRMERNDLANQ